MSQASSKDVFNILKIVVVRLFAVVALISNTRAWSFLVKQKAFTFCQAYGGAPFVGVNVSAGILHKCSADLGMCGIAR